MLLVSQAADSQILLVQLNLAIPDGQNLAPVIHFNIGSGKANFGVLRGISTTTTSLEEQNIPGESRESLKVYNNVLLCLNQQPQILSP